MLIRLSVFECPRDCFPLIAFASRVLQEVKRVTPDPPLGHAAVVRAWTARVFQGFFLLCFPIDFGMLLAKGLKNQWNINIFV